MKNQILKPCLSDYYQWYAAIFGLLLACLSASVFATERVDFNVKRKSAAKQVIHYQSYAPLFHEGALFRAGTYRSWLCSSTTSYERGACSDQHISGDHSKSTYTDILLDFTEVNSKATMRLKLESFFQDIRVDGQFGNIQSINTKKSAFYGQDIKWRALSILLPANEINKLHGGVWVGNLVLNHYSGNSSWLTPLHFRVQVDVKDVGNVQIYFNDTGLEFIAPRIELREVGKSMLEGSEEIDMCLYDGNNNNSSTYILTAKTSDSSDKSFSLTHAKGGSTQDQKIPYNVSIELDGKKTALVNGVQTRLTNSKKSQRSIVLPGLDHPAICGASKLTLVVPRFSKHDKVPGSYYDTLRLTFSGSSSNL